MTGAATSLPPRCGFTWDGGPAPCKRRGAHRCAARVEHVCRFFELNLTHTKGRWARRPFVLTRWERQRIIAPLMGEVIWDDALGRYVRRYRELYLLLCRKNGKTEILAGLVLYLLVADGEVGAEIYGAAMDRDQARIVYRPASRMVLNSPVLRGRLRVIEAAGRIVDEQTGSFYTLIAGDALGALGPDPHACVIDELLTQPSRDLYDALRTSFGARAQPLMLLATTAENDPAGFAAGEREWSERVLAEPELDPERLPVIITAPEGADWTKPATWRAANPALGDFLELRTLASECRKAQGNPAAERAFKQFRLGWPAERTGRAIDLAVWDAAPPGRPEPELGHATCYAGLDLASTSDLAAYALVFPDPAGTGYDVRWHHFAPAARLRDLSRRTGGKADVWVAAGALTITEGDVIDYAAIVAAMNADRERFDIAEVAFDRWGATMLATALLDDGWPLVQVGQGYSTMSAPTIELLRLIRAGAFRHAGNPVAQWEAGNAVTRTDPAGNIKLDKAKSADKIDGLVAAVMALDRALRAAAPGQEYDAAGW